MPRIARAHPIAFGAAHWETVETGTPAAEAETTEASDQSAGSRVYTLTLRIPPGATRGVPIRPVVPALCEVVDSQSLADTQAVVLRWTARCPDPLTGPVQVGFASLPPTLQVHLSVDASQSGQRDIGAAHRLHAEAPNADLRRSVTDSFLALGLHHILGGWDHLLFVLGLFLLVTGWRRRLMVVTGFTVGHSLTLAASALGGLTLDAVSIELLIALSIAFLGREIMARHTAPETPSLIARFPTLVAGAFGLFHGLGFAEALRDAGLGADPLLALFSFNVGVELGQLLFVGALAVLLLLASAGLRLAKRPQAPQNILRTVTPLGAYVVGIGGCYALLGLL